MDAEVKDGRNGTAVEELHWINVRPWLESRVDRLSLRYAELLLRGRDPEDEEALLREAAAARAAGLTIRDLRARLLPDSAASPPPAGPAVGLEELLGTLHLHVPYSAGSPEQFASLALRGAGRIFPLLVDFLKLLGRSVLSPIPIEAACREDEAAHRLKALFDAHGSDKASGHNYHLLYGAILRPPEAVTAVLEVGLGTNHTDVVSHMGEGGRPGASLRAFRDYCPNAALFGADIDRRILFEEERIRTFFVDQTEPDTFAALAAEVPDGFDLVIDDGLHAPAANLATLSFGLRKVRPGGFVVVEDIPDAALPFWQVLAALLPPHLRASLLRARGGCLFVVQR